MLGGVGVEMRYQGCCESCCLDIVQVLAESGEKGVFGLANVMFIAKCAGDEVNQVAGGE